MIAVLIHYIERTTGGYEQLFRRAFTAACREYDFDLVLACGGVLNDPTPEARINNEIYDLFNAEDIDGIILIPAGICQYSGVAALFERLHRVRKLPFCSVGLVVPGVPSVVADNRTGMVDVVEHLITHHGRINLAFLGPASDNLECLERRDVFLEVAQRHGLHIPEHRMLKCWLEPESAEAATTQLLELDRSIDGIVAINDGAAWGALRAIQRFGLRAPEQVAVTGYDDLPMAQLLQPSLTSVSPPLADMATAAVAVIAQQLEGRPPSAITQLPSALVVRRSCGCEGKATARLTAGNITDGPQRDFDERMRLESMFGRTFDLGRSSSLAFNRSEFELLVAERLPEVHPRDCFIGFYASADHRQFRPILPIHLARVQPILPADVSFLSQLGSDAYPRAFLMIGLQLREQLLGIAAFELGDMPFDYPAICDYLVTGWQVVTLHEEVIRQTMLTERSIQERQVAAERSRATTALASAVAHDLNNALGSLVALSDVVYDELEEHCSTNRPLNPEAFVDLRTIKSSALRATETIKDLMTLGRIGRGHQEPFDLVRLTRRVVEEQKAVLAKAHSPSIVVNLDATEQDLVVIGSEPHVERAIGNLLRNATEAVNRGGRVDVSVSMLVLEQTLPNHESIPPGCYAIVSISDTGPGIDAEKQKRLFEPFFSTKHLGESSGSGLGLAIVQSVLREHHGYVDVTSTLDQGSRFTLLLPRASILPQARPSSVPVASGSARILVVDDDVTQLRTAKRVLSRWGYDVTTMASGARAYELVAMEASQSSTALDAMLLHAEQPRCGRPQSSSFDLLILDLALNEDEDGLQIYSKIRKLFPQQRGILASGHAFVDHEEQIREANLVWLPKPYTVESLTTAIRTALRE